MSVVVVGSVNRDVVARVRSIPAPGETVLAHGFTRTAGGKGANQAVAAARAGGAAVAFVGAIGDDADGEDLRSRLAAEGIDVTGIEVVAEPTGTALISVDDRAENAIVVVAGANAALTGVNERQRGMIERAAVLVTQLEVPVELVLDAAAARPAAAWHVLNAAPSAPFSTRGDDLLACLDVLVVNEHELRDIAGGLDFEASVAAVAARVPSLVVTLGSEGCLVVTGETRTRVDAVPARAVDTTGAGDTFCGVLAAALAASGVRPVDVGVDLLATAARAAAAAASLAVRRPGAQDAIPTAAEVADLLRT